MTFLYSHKLQSAINFWRRTQVKAFLSIQYKQFTLPRTDTFNCLNRWHYTLLTMKCLLFGISMAYHTKKCDIKFCSELWTTTHDCLQTLSSWSLVVRQHCQANHKHIRLLTSCYARSLRKWSRDYADTQAVSLWVTQPNGVLYSNRQP
jgi:hypothetical protein